VTQDCSPRLGEAFGHVIRFRPRRRVKAGIYTDSRA
jgi:hypothetical protein